MTRKRRLRDMSGWIGPVCLLSLLTPAVAAPADADPAERGGPTAECRAWLGVRLAPVPEALKAHLGSDGVMVTNVVVDSPADKAGLERYDVIVEFGGQAVHAFADLQAALEKVDPGQDVTLRIIRNGREQVLHVRPGRRPEERFDFRFRYDEPQAERDFLRYFGGRLRRGPDGTWEFEPLGRLRDLLPRELEDEDVPQELRKQLQELRERLREEGRTLRETMRELRDKLRAWDGRDWSRGWPGPDFWLNFDLDQGENVFDGEHLALRLELRDDEHIVIEKDDEGWHVMREDSDGKKRKIADYDNLQTLRKADPEAWRLIRRHLRIGGGGFMFRWPELRRLPELQKRFEEEFRESIRRRHGQHDRDRHEGHAQSGQPEHRRRIARDESGRQILIVQREGGRIRVRVLEEGHEPKTWTFRSLDELREKLPDVYEQARELFAHEDD